MELMDNIGMFCSECAPKPRKDLQDKSLSYFIGKYVKVGFKCDVKGGYREVRIEHMWVRIRVMVDDFLVGHLNNDPLFCSYLKCGI